MTGRTVHLLGPHGHVLDWLASPAWSAPCDDLAEVVRADGSPWDEDGRPGRWRLTNGPDVAPVKSLLHELHPLLTRQPLPAALEGGPVSWTRSAGDPASTGTWQRQHTGSDGLLDWSRFCFTPEYRWSLAATVLEVDQGEYRDLEVACTGPFALFADGQAVLGATTFDYMDPSRHRVRLRLASPSTVLHLATWQVAFREVRHVASVRVIGLPVRVVIPSPDADEFRAAAAERLLDSVGVGPWAAVDGTVRLTGPAGARLQVAVGDRPAVPVVLADGSVTADLRGEPSEDEDVAVEAVASMLDTGETTLRVTADDPRSPVRRTVRAALVPTRHRTTATGDHTTWRRELLQHVTGTRRGTANVLARHALDPDTPVSEADLADALGMIDSRSDCADFEAVGLVTLWHRIPERNWAPGTRDRVRWALLGFKYWIDQPGLDAMCYFTENHQFVWHTAETLIGGLFASDTFANTGWQGTRHAAHGRELAAEWLRRKRSGGFSEFDSNAYLAIDAFALVSLVEFVVDDELAQQAEALLDVVLLTLASNSWRGTHAAAHGRTYTPTQRSARFEETAPIMWLLWGTGSLNDAVLPATALATASAYAVPPVVRRIAQEPSPEWDARQVYRERYRAHHDLLERPYGSELRVWRTPDAVLSSVQDYRAGLPGLQEHVWAATLSPEFQVFATHPAADTISPSARPNAWAGQRVLPRVRQFRHTAVILHRFPDDDWVGRTHLWFPLAHAHEWARRGPWLAARVADGYLAVAAAGGFEPETAGGEAHQAWWAIDGGAAYVATVGRRDVDGDFTAFVDSLGEPEFAVDRAGQASVRYAGRDGAVLSLSWSGVFTVDGRVPDDDSALRLSNPAITCRFGDERLVAEWAGERLEIDLRAGRRLEPSGVRDAR